MDRACCSKGLWRQRRQHLWGTTPGELVSHSISGKTSTFVTGTTNTLEFSAYDRWNLLPRVGDVFSIPRRFHGFVTNTYGCVGVRRPVRVQHSKRVELAPCLGTCPFCVSVRVLTRKKTRPKNIVFFHSFLFSTHFFPPRNYSSRWPLHALPSLPPNKYPFLFCIILAPYGSRCLPPLQF